ncbi:ClbS/DfsB family four-helix bundle protein [Vibrio sp. 188UL20-2]|uniref:ClbS/DfsB family four-helix bundle protein n=2 Tax=Vibrio ulleungensis TaxID=2807619 RepID=A0ABS2HHX1_9VIBR|nr:ClbS/DfsB family four-helix bundle protein [Vibrio ulleungensis]
MSEEALNTEFDFFADASIKEQHWSRDRNLRDVLLHLYEWHQLSIKWVVVWVLS